MFNLKVISTNMMEPDSDGPYPTAKAYAVAIFNDTLYFVDQFRYATHAQATERMNSFAAQHSTVCKVQEPA
jgi:hypothetical protein